MFRVLIVSLIMGGLAAAHASPAATADVWPPGPVSCTGKYPPYQPIQPWQIRCRVGERAIGLHTQFALTISSSCEHFPRAPLRRALIWRGKPLKAGPGVRFAACLVPRPSEIR